MNIIHYLIGLPEYRKGGATIYAFDLLEEQSKNSNNRIAVLIPGDTLCMGKTSFIQNKGLYKGIPIYSIHNPVIEPLMNGVRKAEYILYGERHFNKKNIEDFYAKVHPDVIHLHTLMGIPKFFLCYMKSKGVKIVMTSHDYYGICPRVNLIDKNHHLCSNPSGKFCKDCNSDAKSLWKLYIINSTFFLKFKKFIPRFIKAKFISSTYSFPDNSIKLHISNDETFTKLFQYYMSFFKILDGIHFNSEISKDIYSKYIDLPFNKVIPITNKFISDHRKIKIFSTHLRFTYIGDVSSNKGFPYLKNILISLKREGYNNWELNQWGTNYVGIDKQCDNIKYRGLYIANQLSKIYDETDLLIIPSTWYETFGLVALEALSYGAPVLMTNKVGAQLLIKDLAPDYIVGSFEQMKEKLLEVIKQPNILRDYNNVIVHDKNINFSETKHCKDIINFYKEVIML